MYQLGLYIFRKFNISGNFPEILVKAWKLQRLYFPFTFADIPGSRAKNKLFFSEHNA